MKFETTVDENLFLKNEFLMRFSLENGFECSIELLHEKACGKLFTLL
jgi:hypothetical protein